MAYEYGGDRALDYFPCRYGQSRLLFRGPPRNLDGAYAVVMGGTETYGKFVPDPYAALLEEKLGLPVVAFLCDRLAVMKAGRIVEVAPARTLRTGGFAHPYSRELYAASGGAHAVEQPRPVELT